jgi:hypothetical protein
MLKRTLTVTVLGIVAAIPLFAAGCASNNTSEKPNAVTGTTDDQHQGKVLRLQIDARHGRPQQVWVDDQQPQQQQQQQQQ